MIAEMPVREFEINVAADKSDVTFVSQEIVK